MLGNCIGFGNYKFFLCLLGFGLAQAVFVLLQNAPFVLELLAERSSAGEETAGVVASVAALIAFACTFAALVLLLTHAALAAQNRTSVENSALLRLRRARARGSRDAAAEHARTHAAVLAHNLGRARNLREVFGDAPARWLLPVFSSKGDGCTFRHNSWSRSGDSSDTSSSSDAITISDNPNDATERVELLTGA